MSHFQVVNVNANTMGPDFGDMCLRWLPTFARTYVRSLVGGVFLIVLLVQRFNLGRRAQFVHHPRCCCRLALRSFTHGRVQTCSPRGRLCTQSLSLDGQPNSKWTPGRRRLSYGARKHARPWALTVYLCGIGLVRAHLKGCEQWAAGRLIDQLVKSVRGFRALI